MTIKTTICGLMLCYFKAGMTLQCLKTLANQGIDKIILVDNSADPKENNATLQLTTYFPEGWLEIIISPNNLGFGKGMNLAYAHAKQQQSWDYFLILNNDIQANENLVSTLNTSILEKPECSLISVNANTGNNANAALYYQRLTGLMFNKKTLGCFQIALGYCLMLKAKKIIEPLFDTDFFMYGEDVELTWRYLSQQHQVIFLNQPLLTHLPSQSSQAGSVFYEYHINRGHWLLAKKLSRNSVESILMHLVRIPILTTRALWRLLHKNSNALKGLIELWVPFNLYNTNLTSVAKPNTSLLK